MSLVNIGDLVAPASTLVTKISNALGRHFDPRQEIRMAQARSEADRILRVSAEETDIIIAALRERAADRFLNEEITNQANIESITEKAIHRLTDNATPEGIEDDWLRNFFDKCRIISDADMQQVWAGILAGEANNPGSFSRRTVNLMADFDKDAAELFSNLCSFVWSIDEVARLLVYDTGHDIYNKCEIGLATISHLESLGVIRYHEPGYVKVTDLPKIAQTAYQDNLVTLTFPKDDGNDLNIGHVIFTFAGLQLSTICEPTPVEGFFEYVYDRWAGESLVPPRNSQQDA